ncbi:MAG: hypothetical protein K5985_11740, partial [Lachnospiraceae bacterium]|nr:hypothetical protein [Lachnospiraceae bacterium]
KEDYFDYEHLNMSGQLKFTDYLGKILVSDYNVIPGELSEKERNRWDKGLIMFRKYAETGMSMSKEEKAGMGRLLEYESSALVKMLSEKE